MPTTIARNILTVMLCGGAMALVVLHYAGYGLLSVQSDSMHPQVTKGDAVVVRHAVSRLTLWSHRPVQKGDIITVPDPADSRLMITHRVVSLNPDGTVTTKGDANVTPDRPTAIRAIAGQMQFVVPHAGRLLDSLKRPWGLALLVYVPSASIVYAEVIRLRNDWRRPSASGRGRAGRYSLYGY